MMMTLFDVASSLSKDRALQLQQPQQQRLQPESLMQYRSVDNSYDCNAEHGTSIRDHTLPAFADMVSSLSKK